MDGGDDVESEPTARHDDEPSMVVGRTGVRADFTLIDLADIAAVLDRPRHRVLLPWLPSAHQGR